MNDEPGLIQSQLNDLKEGFLNFVDALNFFAEDEVVTAVDDANQNAFQGVVTNGPCDSCSGLSPTNNDLISHDDGAALETELDRLIEIVTNPKNISEAILAIIEILRLLSLYADAKTAQDFITKHMTLWTGMSDAEKLLIDEAWKSSKGSAVSIISELWGKAKIEEILMGLGASENVAESLAATLVNAGVAFASGGGTVIPQLIDQTILISRASNEAEDAREKYAVAAMNGAVTVVNSYLSGAISDEEAIGMIQASQDLNRQFFAYRQVYKKVDIVNNIAVTRIKQDSNRFDNSGVDGVYYGVVAMGGALDPSEPLSANYLPFANQVASSFGLVGWPGHQ